MSVYLRQTPVTIKNQSTNLEISSFIQRVRRPEERHLPAEEILIVGQLHPEPLDRLLLETFVLERQSAQSAAARLRRALCHPLRSLQCHTAGPPETTPAKSQTDRQEMSGETGEPEVTPVETDKRWVVRQDYQRPHMQKDRQEMGGEKGSSEVTCRQTDRRWVVRKDHQKSPADKQTRDGW